MALQGRRRRDLWCSERASRSVDVKLEGDTFIVFRVRVSNNVESRFCVRVAKLSCRDGWVRYVVAAATDAVCLG